MKIHISIVLTSLLFLFLVGCTGNAEQETQDENIETIDAVLQNALNGPDEEMKEVLRSDNMEDTVQYDKEHYEPYFANETAYMEFVNSYGTVLMIAPFRNEYTLQINNVEYEKTDSDETIYNFSVDLQYQKEGAEDSEVAVVKGQANLNEEHKIKDILVKTEDLWGILDE